MSSVNNQSTLQSTKQSLLSSSQAAMDKIYPAERRASLQASMKAYTSRHPKLSALILINVLLTGPPLLLFVLYTLTIFLFSFSTVLMTTFVLASLFTASMVGVALLVLVPTVLVTTAAAIVLFGWGMLGYWVLDWAGRTERGQLLREQLQRRQQQQQESSTRVEGQQTRHGGFGNYRKGIRPSPAREDVEGRSEAITRGEESDMVGQDDKNEWRGEQGNHESKELKASEQTVEPIKDVNESFHLPVRTYSNTGQADYKATIAEDGAYIEVAPGLDTVHSIAVSTEDKKY